MSGKRYAEKFKFRKVKQAAKGDYRVTEVTGQLEGLGGPHAHLALNRPLTAHLTLRPLTAPASPAPSGHRRRGTADHLAQRRARLDPGIGDSDTPYPPPDYSVSCPKMQKAQPGWLG